MKFLYSGPSHAAEIFPIAESIEKDAEARTAEPLVSGWLKNGAEVDLPEDHPVAKAWLARRWLTAVDPKPVDAKPEAPKPTAPAPAPAVPGAPTAPPFVAPTATGPQTNS